MSPKNTGLAGTIALALTLPAAAGAVETAGDAYFNRIATVPNFRNRTDFTESTVSEIVAATEDGKLLVYTDAAAGSVGVINIENPYQPFPFGTVDVGGDPTSVDILGNDYALVGVNTSASFIDTSGHLAVVDLATRDIVASIDLGGQPDSLKVSPDGAYVAVVIENERDEFVCVGGTLSGAPAPEDGPEEPGDITEDECEAGGGAVGIVPQTEIGNPPGYLAIVDVAGTPATWGVRHVDLTGLSDLAPTDPEAEFVDINAYNHAVVSLQENNHIVVVNLKTGKVAYDFPAGTVDLVNIDADEDDNIVFDDTLSAVPREPDAIAWVRGKDGEYLIATANEGDLNGGSRGFTLFDKSGAVVYDSGADLEYIAARHGHYPESRSENKGNEPESIAYGNYGGEKHLFVGSERGSFVAVYTVEEGMPEFKQLLPAPLGPEGVLPIPQRNLLVVSGEEDDPEFGVRSTVQIYRRVNASAPNYPQILSANDAAGLPIPWSALSGMDAVPGENAHMLAVWDSYYGVSKIFTIDATSKPAVITAATTISGAEDLDPEGIAIAPDGTYWVASEGNASGSRPNRLLQVTPDGAVLQEIGLPAEIESCRQAENDAEGNTGTLGSGFEGVAIQKTSGDEYRLLVAQQRGWDYTTGEDCEALDDDHGGLDANGEPLYTRIWTYEPDSGEWGHIAWQLAALPPNASWVGLSEISAAPWGTFVVIERDNRTGEWAELKSLVAFHGSALSDGTVTAGDKRVYDAIPKLEQSKGWISDKPEGVAVTDKGNVYLVTDNDGVDDWSGETAFLKLGNVFGLFWKQ